MNLKNIKGYPSILKEIYNRPYMRFLIISFVLWTVFAVFNIFFFMYVSFMLSFFLFSASTGIMTALIPSLLLLDMYWEELDRYL